MSKSESADRAPNQGKTFLSLCLKGEAKPSWHSGASELELHEFLGMSWPEYSTWVTDPDAIDSILKVRREAVENGPRQQNPGPVAPSRSEHRCFGPGEHAG